MPHFHRPWVVGPQTTAHEHNERGVLLEGWEEGLLPARGSQWGGAGAREGAVGGRLFQAAEPLSRIERGGMDGEWVSHKASPSRGGERGGRGE